MRLLVLLLALLPLAGCASPEREPTAEASVEVVSYQYAPAPLEVAPGTRVTFTNRDLVAHTVTPDDADLWGNEGSGTNSPDWLGKDAAWAHTFWDPGTYTYYCVPHPNMTAAVVVR